MLVYTKSITEHRVLASTQRGITAPREKGSATAIGEMLDKCARVGKWAPSPMLEGLVLYEALDANIICGRLYSVIPFGSSSGGILLTMPQSSRQTLSGPTQKL